MLWHLNLFVSKIRKVFSYLRASGATRWVVPVLVSALWITGAWMIIGAGPEVARLAVGLVTGTSGDIYGSVLGNSLLQIPDYATWIGDTFSPIFLFAAALIHLCSARATTARTILLRVAASASLALVLGDVYFAILEKSINWDVFLRIIFIDGAGAVLIAVLWLAITKTSQSAKAYVPRSASIVMWATIPLVVGALLNFAVFTVAKHFYGVTPSRIALVATPPFNGSYAVQVGAETRLGILEARSLSERLSLLGVANDMKVVWNSRGPDRSPEVAVWLMDYCRPGTNWKAALTGHEPLIRRRISQFSIGVNDGGMAQIEATSDGNSLGFATVRDMLVQFNVLNGVPGTSPRLSLFVGESATTTVDQTSRDALYAIYLMPNLVEDEGSESFSRVARSVSLSFDPGNRYEMDLEPVKLHKDDRVQCAPVELLENEGNRKRAATTMPVLVLRVSSSDGYSRNYGILDVKGLSGWVETEVAGAGGLGSVSFLALRGEDVSLLLDGSEHQLARRTRLQIHGSDLVGALDDSGILEVLGTASLIYEGGERLSVTRWERFPAELRWGLIGLFFSCCAVILSWVAKALKDDEIFEPRF